MLLRIKTPRGPYFSTIVTEIVSLARRIRNGDQHCDVEIKSTHMALDAKEEVAEASTTMPMNLPEQ
jgi:hypothetical protein